MDTLSEEVLCRILSLVPYSPKQLMHLGHVNRRFRHMVRYTSFHVKMAKAQHPEILQLYDLPQVELFDMPYIQKLQMTVDGMLEKIFYTSDHPGWDAETYIMTPPRESQDMRSILAVAYHILLSYCENLQPDPVQNTIFLEWLKFRYFSKPLVQLLRYAINRINQYERDPGYPNRHRPTRSEVHDLWDLYGTWPLLKTMMSKRSFETGLLVVKESVPLERLLGFCLPGPRLISVSTKQKIQITLRSLSLAYDHALAFLIESNWFPHSEAEHTEHKTFLQSFQWRLLNDQDCSCHEAFTYVPEPHSDLNRHFAHEVHHDWEFAELLEKQSKNGEGIKWINSLDLRQIGRDMREVKRRIQSDDVPEEILRRVENMLPKGQTLSAFTRGRE